MGEPGGGAWLTHVMKEWLREMAVETLIALPSILLVLLLIVGLPILALSGLVRGFGMLTGRLAGTVGPPITSCNICHGQPQAGWRYCANCGRRLA